MSDKSNGGARASVSAGASAHVAKAMQGEKTSTRLPPQRDRLTLVGSRADLWHSPDGDAYASVCVGGHKENWPLRTSGFKIWLVLKYYTSFGSVPGAQAVEDALRVIKASAIHEGPVHPVSVRVGSFRDQIYVDLGDEHWRAVEVDPEGWRIVPDPPVKFVRPRGMRPLPEPNIEGSVDELRPFLSVTAQDFPLAVSWMLGTLRPRGPYPVLVLSGEQGAAKSTSARVLRALTDPNSAPIRTVPREERDLIVAARNSWVIALDNLSNVPPWLADGLCRLATGGGFGARRLHTDLEEVLFEAQRPIILNGIADLVSRPDLADRAIVLTLPAIEDARRQRESDFWREFERVRPFIFGGLLNALRAALSGYDEVELDGSARTADFAHWAAAAESDLPWEPGAFWAAYRDNMSGMAQATIENDIVGQEIKRLADDVISDPSAAPENSPPGTWQGTATDLLRTLRDRLGTELTESRFFPKAPNGLSARVRRIAPALRASGVNVEVGRTGHDRTRTILIRRCNPN